MMSATVDDEVDQRPDGVADAVPEAGVLEVAEVDPVEVVDGQPVERVLVVADVAPTRRGCRRGWRSCVSMSSCTPPSWLCAPGQLVAELVGLAGVAGGVGRCRVLGVADVAFELAHLRRQPSTPLLRSSRARHAVRARASALSAPSSAHSIRRLSSPWWWSKMSAARPAIRGTSSSSPPTSSTKRAKALGGVALQRAARLTVVTEAVELPGDLPGVLARSAGRSRGRWRNS